MSHDDDVARLTTDPALSDHKRFGKRLIAPWNQGELKLRESDWRLHRLPEFIWIAELMAELGVDRSQALLTAIIDAVQRAAPKDDPTFPILASYWHHCAAEVKSKTIKRIRDQKLASELKMGLQNFACLYPDYPACKLLGRSRIKSCRATYLFEFKERLISLLSRFSIASVAMHAQMIKSLTAAGVLMFPQGMPPVNFELAFQKDADQNDPEFEMLAGFVRASVNSFFGVVADNFESVAPKLFWQRNLAMQPCMEFPPEHQQ